MKGMLYLLLAAAFGEMIKNFQNNYDVGRYAPG